MTGPVAKQEPVPAREDSGGGFLRALVYVLPMSVVGWCLVILIGRWICG